MKRTELPGSRKRHEAREVGREHRRVYFPKLRSRLEIGNVLRTTAGNNLQVDWGIWRPLGKDLNDPLEIDAALSEGHPLRHRAGRDRPYQGIADVGGHDVRRENLGADDGVFATVGRI